LDATHATLSDRLLEVLEGLLRAPAGDLKTTLTYVSDLVAAASGADKIDAFLYDASRDSLVALGTSNQPLSALQVKLGLNVLPLSNGGRTVEVFKTGQTYFSGHVDEDPEELLGIRQALAIRSEIGVPLEVGSERRGMLMAASQKPDFFTAEDARMAETVGRWVGVVAHRAELIEEIGRNATEQGRRAGAEELVTILAHDLRNYLGPLGLRLQLLRHRAERDKRTEELADLEVIRRSVSRLEGLVSDILDVARIDQGVFRLQPEEVDLAALAADVVAMFTTPQHPVNASIEHGEKILVIGDPARLRQCLENLIVNAIQKSPRDAAVTVFLRRERQADGKSWARLEVRDQGPGIPNEMLPHIFERFYTGKRREGGLGLGLYLAKRIASVHGGDLTAASPPGKGASFVLALPAL
jgi:two-component system OmpR family sensor kinase